MSHQIRESTSQTALDLESARPESFERRVEDRQLRKLGRLVAECIETWSLIEDGDRILVGMSGGKDSYTLLHVLMRTQRVAPVRFELVPFHLDQGHPGFPTERLRAWLEATGLDWVIHHQDTHSLVLDKLQPGQTTCALCARLRRGIMYKQAVELGCTKIALGHHRGDSIETLLLNIFYSGQLKAMPARLQSDDRQNVVIRPLLYVPEPLIADVARQMGFPIIPCTLCSKQPDHKRAAMKQLLDRLEADNEHVRGNMLAALGNVVPSHLLDTALFDPVSEHVDPDEFDDALPT